MKKTRKRIGSLLLSLCMVFTMLPTVAFAAPTTQIAAVDALADDVRLREVKFGTAENELNLPSTLNATTTSGSTYTINILQWGCIPTYDGNNARNYAFVPIPDLPSDVTLADGVTLPNITVTVLAPVPVTNITDVIDTMGIGDSVGLSGTVAPADATNQDISWSIKNVGTTGATITGGTLSATAPGTVVVTATIADGTATGTNYTQDFTISVKVLTVNPSTYIFDTLEEGYGNAQPKTFTITNTGDTELTGLVLNYSTNSGIWFSQSFTHTSLASTASAEFTLIPYPDLLAGTYTATLMVISNSNILVSIPVSLTVTQQAPRLKFGATDAHEVDTNFSGTGYSWNATTKTLTLTSDYVAGRIQFMNFESETATLKLDGDVTIDETASSSSCLYNSGNLTIDLDGHTLTLITGGRDNRALSVNKTTIQNGTLVARLQGSGTDDTTESIDANVLTVENATVIADADSPNYGGMHVYDTLTLNQGAKVYTCGALGLRISSPDSLNLTSDDISLTAIGSTYAINLYGNLDYTPAPTLKCWTNTDTTQPSPVGEGSLLSSKTDAEWANLWGSSKYVYIGKESPKSIVTVTNGTGSREYSKDALVTITANAAPSGKKFKEWTVVSGGVTLGNTKASTTSFTMPANMVAIMATYEDIPTTTVTGSVNISGHIINLSHDASGTNWAWDASSATLTLTGDVGGIRFNASGDITVAVNGNVNTAFLYHNNISAGKLTINGSGTLNVSYSNTGAAIFVNNGLEIAEATVNMSTTENDSHAVNLVNGDFTMSSGKLSLYTTGKNSDGICCQKGDVLISNTAEVKTTPSVTGYGLNVDGDIEISGGTVDVASTKRSGIVATGEVRISGGLVTAKSTHSNGAVRGDKDGVTVSGGTLITGIANASPVNGSVGSNLTVSGANTQVTVNGAIKNNGNLTVSGGNVSVTGTVAGTQNLTGGTVYVNGVQVYPTASTYAVTVNNGTANNSTVEEGATVTITANTPVNGKRFKAWVVENGGVTLVNEKAFSTTFIMPANAVVVTATYEDIPAGVKPVTGITLNKTSLSLYSNTGTKTANLTATITPADATDKSVTWQSSNTSVATVDVSGQVIVVGNGTANITVTATDGGHTTSCVVTVSTYTSGGGSGGGSSSGGSSPANTATIKENQPNQPVTAVAPVTSTVGTNGIASASIPDNAVTNAIAKAQAEAAKQENPENGISIGLNVTMPQGTTALTATLSQNALGSLVSTGVTNLEINSAPVSISFDQNALAEIQRQTNGNIDISFAPQAQLSETARSIIGTRPVYNITVSSGSNNTVSSFGQGSATVALLYTPTAGELISGLHAVYLDPAGNATRVGGSFYSPQIESIIFTTHHFSMYGVGYSTPSEKLTDISNHWAKESIDYVVNKGMIDPATETTFAPDTFMTRGTLVTALGRLAGEDVSSYTASSFTDVKVGSTSQPYIEWAYEAKIIHGIGNNEFAPGRAITREEIAVIIANFTNATGYTLPANGDATAYADASSIGDYYKTSVTAMQQAGIMTGGTDNKFNPKSNATRAEVSSMLHRYIKLITELNTAQD